MRAVIWPRSPVRISSSSLHAWANLAQAEDSEHAADVSFYGELQVTSDSRMGRRSWVPEEAVSLTGTEGGLSPLGALQAYAEKVSSWLGALQAYAEKVSSLLRALQACAENAPAIFHKAARYSEHSGQNDLAATRQSACGIHKPICLQGAP